MGVQQDNVVDGGRARFFNRGGERLGRPIGQDDDVDVGQRLGERQLVVALAQVLVFGGGNVGGVLRRDGLRGGIGRIAPEGSVAERLHAYVVIRIGRKGAKNQTVFRRGNFDR